MILLHGLETLQKSREYDCHMFCNIKYVTLLHHRHHMMFKNCHFCSKSDILFQKLGCLFDVLPEYLKGFPWLRSCEMISLGPFFRDQLIWSPADGFGPRRTLDPLFLVNISLMYIGNDLHEFLYCPNKQFYLQPKLQKLVFYQKGTNLD